LREPSNLKFFHNPKKGRGLNVLLACERKKKRGRKVTFSPNTELKRRMIHRGGREKQIIPGLGKKKKLLYYREPFIAAKRRKEKT